MNKQEATLRVNAIPVVLLLMTLCSDLCLGQQAYHLEVVAQTGVPVGGARPAALGSGPSVNDAGKSAFVARDGADQTGRVVVLSGNVVERNYPVTAPATLGDFVQINNEDQVVYQQGFRDGLVSHIQRLDSIDAGVTIASGSYSFLCEAPFLEVLPCDRLVHFRPYSHPSPRTSCAVSACGCMGPTTSAKMGSALSRSTDA